jgi:DNA-binding FadR family transcriptional regulator
LRRPKDQLDKRFHMAVLRASGNDLLVPLGVLIESALNHLFVHVTREDSSLLRAQKLHEKYRKVHSAAEAECRAQCGPQAFGEYR